MWNRANLKARAKYSFKRNYWKCVLISTLLTLIVGGSSFVGSGTSSSTITDRLSSKEDTKISETPAGEDDANAGEEKDYEAWKTEAQAQWSELETELGESGMVAFCIAFVIAMVIGSMLVLALFIVLEVFVFNPIEVGGDRFFLHNLNAPAQVGNVGYAFDNNYKNIAKTMFFRDLYTILWTLPFVIPGIVKSYEYQMIPYLLAEYPYMTKEQAFAESKRMMHGQKWRAFVLDLSFLGWNILSALTLGILGIFYVQPYMNATGAALYEALRYEQQYRQS
jgi:hypothetical protein